MRGHREPVLLGELRRCGQRQLPAVHSVLSELLQLRIHGGARSLEIAHGTFRGDLRREPIEVRKATLASILQKSRHGVRLNEHLEHDSGLTVFQHACKMGLEGIVSKRLGSRYRSARSPDWLKFKNPDAPAVKREAEEDWGR
jgi:hypothetical protein